MEYIFLACILIAGIQWWTHFRAERRVSELREIIALHFTKQQTYISESALKTDIHVSNAYRETNELISHLDAMVEVKIDTYHIEKLMPALKLIASTMPSPPEVCPKCLKKEEEKPKPVAVEERKPLDITSSEFKEIEKQLYGTY